VTYYMHDGPAAFSFELAGAVCANDAAELEQAWRTASSTIGDRILVVDLSFVTRIDEAARNLLRRWHENGATLVANSPQARFLAESIIGALPLAAAAAAPTYEPLFTKHTARVAVVLFTLMRPITVSAGEVPGYRQVPGAGQQAIDTNNMLARVSPLTVALSEMQASGS